MEFYFKVDPDTLTLRDLVAYEEMQLDGKEMKARDIANMVARFLADEDGKPIERNAALEIVLDFSMTKLKEAAEKLKKAVQEAGDSQVPPAQSDKSLLPYKTGRRAHRPSRSSVSPMDGGVPRG